ncbi:MAG: rod shape-determining protein MreD [Proteobacteria bacterium]|nr:rod shape-determining protein MreD [Pseudomonadota bacterium]
MKEDVRIQPLSIKGWLYCLLTGFIVLLFQGSIEGWLIPDGFGPDLSLILVLYLGLFAPLHSGALIVTALGFFKDVSGGGAFGVHPGIFLVIFLLEGQLRQKIDPAAPWYQMLYIGAFTLVSGSMVWLSFYLLGGPSPAPPETFSNPMFAYLLSCLLTAGVGPIFFWLFDLIVPWFGLRTEAES